MHPAPSVGRPSRRAVVLALSLATLLGGCGGDARSDATPYPDTTTDGATTYPLTVTAGNGEVTLESVPRRIVSLSPSATETLYAVGAGAQVVAVDDQSDHPAEAPRTKLSGFQPNAEAVTGHDPDLVVLANDTNGIVRSLGSLGIPVMLLAAPTTLEGGHEQILTLGRATGHASEARRVVDSVRSRIDAAVASLPASARGMSVYHELDASMYSVTSGTFIGSLYTRFGLRNIADAAPDAAGGYPRLSAEYVVTAAPDVIVLTDAESGGQTPEKVAARPAFDAIPAVRERRVVAMDEDIASRWGPRVADFAEALAGALNGVKGAGATSSAASPSTSAAS